MKRFLSLALAALLLTGCAAPAASGSFRQVSAREAISMMEEEKDYIILDVRTPEEYAQAHIPGAINIPNETIADRPPEQLPDKGALILVYCRSGNRSKQASRKLAAMGYTSIVEFGGINSWPGETVSGSDA